MKKEAQKNSLIEKLINSLRDDYIRNIILHKNSFNEISIFGNNKLYRIDKLIIDTDEKKILIIDYKTNTEAKNTSNKYIEQYKKQLFDYKVIIQNIYPEYKVQTAILWIADFSVSMFDL